MLYFLLCSLFIPLAVPSPARPNRILHNPAINWQHFDSFWQPNRLSSSSQNNHIHRTKANSLIYCCNGLFPSIHYPCHSSNCCPFYFVVGDDKGWTINFNYQTWAQGKQFYVGDTLVFKYPKGVHNVYKVNGTGFQQCAAPLDSVPLTSGNDVVTLATPGRKWYICGVGQHCRAGNQKLLLTVMPSSAPSPSPSYTASSPSTSIPYTPAAISVGTRYGWMMVIFGLLVMLTA